jgi:hypothetical protein
MPGPLSRAFYVSKRNRIVDPCEYFVVEWQIAALLTEGLVRGFREGGANGVEGDQ